MAEAFLGDFAKEWGKKYPMTSKQWKSRWAEAIPFFKFSPAIRKGIYATNAIESLNYSMQKIIKHRQVFPNDESALKLMFMALKSIEKKWTRPFRDWGAAVNEFALIYGERVPL